MAESPPMEGFKEKLDVALSATMWLTKLGLVKVGLSLGGPLQPN